MMMISINKSMQIYNGNGKKNLDVAFQNIPGTLSHINKITTIQSLISRYNPDVLGLAEPSTDDLDVHWPDYTLVPGTVNDGNSTNTRLNILIKNEIEFTQISWKSDVPHCVLQVKGWTIVMVYREWAKLGDQTSKSHDLQYQRWKTLVSNWKKLKGTKVVVLGDFNFDSLTSCRP